MEKKKTLSFTLGVVAIILGVTLFKQFDFERFRFEKTGLAIVYLITFVIVIGVLVRSAKNS